MSGTCEHCQKPLRKFTSTVDWRSRKYHKKCYKQKQAFQEALDMYNQIKTEFENKN